MIIKHSFARMLSTIPRTEKTPPLYYVLAWVWSRVFGHGEVGLRSMSAIAGTLTVPVAARIAKRLFDVRAGLFAAMLVAVNPFLVFYSQEARSYALLVLFSTCALWAFIEVLNATRGRWPSPYRLSPCRWRWRWAESTTCFPATSCRC